MYFKLLIYFEKKINCLQNSNFDPKPLTDLHILVAQVVLGKFHHANVSF